MSENTEIGKGRFTEICAMLADLVMRSSGFDVTLEVTESANPARCRGVLTVKPDVITQTMCMIRGEAFLPFKIVIEPITEHTEKEMEMANLYRVQDSNGERHIVAADSETHARELVSSYAEKVGAGKVTDSRVEYLGQADLVSSGAVLSGEDENNPKPSGTQTTVKK